MMERFEPPGLPETFREWRDAQKAVVADEPMRRAA